MEIRGKAWTAGNLEPFTTTTYVNSVAATDPIVAIESAYGSLAERLFKEKAVQRSLITYSMGPGEFDLIVKGVKEKALKKGREEAWDLARRIATYGAEGAYTFKDVRNVFCTNTLTKVFNTPVEEALDKDKKHQEEKKELHVGDEVEFTGFANSLMRGYVMNLNAPGDRCVVILYKMGSYHRRPNECIKTGKHNLDIEKVMASFEKGEEDGDI